MTPTIIQDAHHGLPSLPRPDRDRTPPLPWSLDLLAIERRVHHHALSPDGTRLGFIWNDGLGSDVWLTPTDAQRWPRQLTHARPPHTWWDDRAPAWDRHGARLLVEREGEIWLVDAADGHARALTAYDREAAWPLFSHDGRRVFFTAEQDERANLASIEVEARPGAWPTALTHLDGDVSMPELSPDGRTLAFMFSPRDDLERSDIALVPADGGDVRRLTGAPRVSDRRPRWSPDGANLVFTSNRTGWTELFLMALASGAVTQLTRGSADTADPAWSPSGEDIAFVQEVGGCGRLCSLRPAAPEVRVLRETTGWHSRPQWDPGGNALTVEFESATTPPDVYRLQLDGRRTVRETPLTDSRSPAVESSGLVSPELVRYPSLDGTPIVGYLYRPQRASSSSPCPAIVHPHGGPTESWGFLWSLRVQWLVAKGYAVLAPDYRGSTGHGLDFQRALIGQWGVVDTQDILSGADYLGSLGWVDARRLAVFGSSYGCYLAVLALARDPQQRFRCAAGEYGDSDILRSWATGDRPGREDLERQMGRPPGRQEAYRRGSPIHDVSEIHAPLLLAHGLDDERVDPRQSEELVAELQRLGKTFEYVTYAGEGHGLLNPANLRHFYSRLERFLDWHLM